jgi:MYXO-CTERM domain-containing protein
MRIFAAVIACVLGSAEVAYALELKNDSWVDNTAADFMGGFAVGEIGASRFVAPDPGRQLLKLQLLFGPDAASPSTITVHVWDDSAGADAPGTELFTGDYQIMGSSSAIHDIDIAATMNVAVPAQFRVGIEFHNKGAPSIACDTNGNQAGKNFIKESTLGWTKSSTLGVPGDWIIRAFVSDVGSPSPDAGAGGTGAACNGNPDCPAGQYCDNGVHHCTFDCRMDSDCGGGTCNSLGQCVGGKSGGCAIDGGDAAGALAIGMAGVVFALRRRRAART